MRLVSVKSNDRKWWRHKVLRNGGEKWGRKINQGLRGLEKNFGLQPSDSGGHEMFRGGEGPNEMYILER